MREKLIERVRRVWGVNMNSIEAYIDGYDKLVIEVAKYFYGGQSDEFYVSRYDCSLEKLNVRSKYELEDRVVYIADMFKNLEIGKFYQIVDNHGYRNYFKYRHIVRSKRFNEEFYYGGDDLGYTYDEKHTVFKLWAPTATQVLIELFDGVNRNSPRILMMKRKEKGVFVCDVEGDLDGTGYLFAVTRNGETVMTIDPYARASGINGRYSVVVNRQKTDVKKIPLVHSGSPIIYEASVRDFTSGLKDCHRASFKGFVTENLRTSNNRKAGFDYLKSLGVTHVQLMPIYDFYTVDEENKFLIYNWGYDPQQYNVPEGSYASNPLNPASWISDLKEMVQKLHENGMQVVMDVVYNHMYDRDKSPFELVLPYYYFRMNEHGQWSNGSFCGNDFDSTMPMCRKYIVDSIAYWMDEYDIDGFRFDLMGILDVDTMRQIEHVVHAKKPHGLVYGEGWNMPTMLDEERKAHMHNAYIMPRIAFFNDSFRDTCKGRTGEHDGGHRGYLSGDLNQIEYMKQALCGNNHTQSFMSPLQSINYVECHDNATAYDKLKMCCHGEDEANIKKRAKLLLAAIMVAQGIPFIHSGQEFCRTKGLRHNTYNAPDEINKLDYERKDEFYDIVEFTKQLIKLRKEYPVFMYETYQEIQEHVSFETIQYGALKYSIIDERGSFDIYFNPTYSEIPFKGGEVILSSEPIVNKSLPILSFCVVKKEVV